MKLITGQSKVELAQQLATGLSIPLTHLALKRCDNGESLARVDENLVFKEQIVIAHVLEKPVDSSLMDLLLIIDAVKSAQPESLALILPCYPYSRQDHPTPDSTGSAAKLVMRLLAAAGIDKLITVDMHRPDTLKNAPFKVCEVSPIPLFAKKVLAKMSSALIVAPDQGAIHRAKALADCIKTDWTFLTKQRLENGDIVMGSLTRGVEGRDCILVDDIIDSGKTLFRATDYLLANGAHQIDAFVTHGVFGHGCLDRLTKSTLKSLTITNTLDLDPGILEHPKISCVDIASILAKNKKNLFFL
ncbi:ribose-phosphate diphosphokinase [Candidatus Finniella inopinata]|uniref:ribose-phosphate diphosphokinase n=1 Tax=Candidatus Finniella inopinata TaxID=1696036 RepID=A0A4Q7DGB8_9PROT|nr:ribose-phosphate diphosphokinase [Candidatus Finniella inopinata]RZI45702.1 ribose-phosphate pyrophosphokinase [Candidatus Finniella inopinata]